MQLFRWIGLLLLCGVLAAPVRALDLYQGEARVDGPDEASRAAGVVRALEQVLAKVAGKQELGDNPVLAEALTDASKLMQRFEYRQELVRDADGRPLAHLYLIASFYPSSIDELLGRAGVTVWGRERPRVLVLIESQGSLLGREALAALSAQADVRGLSLRFSPDVDLAEVQQLRAQSGGALSARFGGVYVLSGALDSGEFQLDTGRDQRRLSVDPAAGAEAQQIQLADALQRALVSTQLSGSNDPEDVRVRIEGVTSAGDYARVLSYLGKLTPVRSVQVQGVRDDRLHLALNVLGGAARLQQTVEVGRLLEVRSADATLVLALRGR